MEPEPSSPVPVDRPLSELSPVPVCESAESRTSPRRRPTRPDERVVDEVDDSRRFVSYYYAHRLLDIFAARRNGGVGYRSTARVLESFSVLLWP